MPHVRQSEILLRGPLSALTTLSITSLPIIATSRRAALAFVERHLLTWRRDAHLLFGGYFASTTGDCYFPDIAPPTRNRSLAKNSSSA